VPSIPLPSDIPLPQKGILKKTTAYRKVDKPPPIYGAPWLPKCNYKNRENPFNK